MDLPPLEPGLQAIAVALGLFSTTDGTTSLNTSFFTNPLKTVEGFFASDQRLDALSDALAAVLGEAQLRLPPPAPDGASVHCFPIVPSSASGGVYLYLERTATSSTLGLVAEGAHGASGATFDVSAPLVSGTVGTSVAPSFVTGTAANAAAGTADNPVRLDATLPVAWAAPAKPFGLAAVQLTGLIYLDLGQSRLQLTLVGLDLGDGPKDLSFDPQHIGPETADLVMAALRAALTTAGLSPSDPVNQFVEALPVLSGRLDGAPPLDLKDVVANPGAFRDWLGTLAKTTLPAATGTGETTNALCAWLVSLGQLLGAAPPAEGVELPTAAAPLQLVLLHDSDGSPLVQLQAALVPAASTGSSSLQLGFVGQIGASHLGLPGDTLPDAFLAAEVSLLSLPLTRTAPVEVLPSARIYLDSGAPVHPAKPGDPTGLTVGRVRAGLSITGVSTTDGSTASGSTTPGSTSPGGISPLLELDDVAASIPGVTPNGWQVPTLALGPTQQLGAAAGALLQPVLAKLVGSGNVAAALLQLVGLTDAASFEAFVTDPAGSITTHYRNLLAGNQLPDFALSLAQLLGLSLDPASGAGTTDAPCLISLTGLSAASSPGPPVGSATKANLALWQETASSTSSPPGLRIGFRASAGSTSATPPWQLSWTGALVGFDLPPAGSSGRMAVQLPGRQDVSLQLGLSHLPPGVLGAADLTISAGWQPGSPLAVSGTVTGLAVQVDGAAVPLGDVSFPPGLSLDGITGTKLRAVGALLGTLASSLDPALGVLAGLAGIGLPVANGLPADWPSLSDLAPTGIPDLLVDPVGGLMKWLQALAGAGPAPGSVQPHLLVALHVLQEALLGAAPSRPASLLPTSAATAGNGSAADPWELVFGPASSSVSLLLWLGPDGPSGSWSSSLRADLESSIARSGAWPFCHRDQRLAPARSRSPPARPRRGGLVANRPGRRPEGGRRCGTHQLLPPSRSHRLAGFPATSPGCAPSGTFPPGRGQPRSLVAQGPHPGATCPGAGGAELRAHRCVVSSGHRSTGRRFSGDLHGGQPQGLRHATRPGRLVGSGGGAFLPGRPGRRRR